MHEGIYGPTRIGSHITFQADHITVLSAENIRKDSGAGRTNIQATSWPSDGMVPATESCGVE